MSNDNHEFKVQTRLEGRYQSLHISCRQRRVLRVPSGDLIFLHFASAFLRLQSDMSLHVVADRDRTESNSTEQYEWCVCGTDVPSIFFVSWLLPISTPSMSCFSIHPIDADYDEMKSTSSVRRRRVLRVPRSDLISQRFASAFLRLQSDMSLHGFADRARTDSNSTEQSSSQ